MKLFRRKNRRPSPEVVAAVEAAEKSAKQAQADLAKETTKAHVQEQKLSESRPIIEALRRRNEANHYDQMLEEWLRTR
jgi:hypothetical protein